MSHQTFVVSLMVKSRHCPRKLGNSIIDHRKKIRRVVRRGVPRPQHPRQGSPVASAKQNNGWNPNPPSLFGVVPCSFSEWISTSVASTSRITGPSPSVAAVRRYTSQRTSAIAQQTPATASGASVLVKVRNNVVSKHTSPNKRSRDPSGSTGRTGLDLDTVMLGELEAARRIQHEAATLGAATDTHPVRSTDLGDRQRLRRTESCLRTCGGDRCGEPPQPPPRPRQDHTETRTPCDSGVGSAFPTNGLKSVRMQYADLRLHPQTHTHTKVSSSTSLHHLSPVFNKARPAIGLVISQRPRSWSSARRAYPRWLRSRTGLSAWKRRHRRKELQR